MIRVAYLTDIEGMWTKLAAFAEANPLVRLEGDRLIISDGALFVFGGDAVDRGPHSRRIVRALLDAKRRQPEQVVLLAGNRDLNKLRLRRELQGHPPQRMPEDVRRKPLPDQLRWIMSNTMGAAGAFEHRRTELAAEQRGSGDDDVVASFIDDVRDGGVHREYLLRCQLGLRVGRTLFVHGGVTEENYLAVPGRERAPNLDAWLDSLNGWYREQLDSELSASLMAYQAPLPGTRLNQTSVVYGRTADPHNNPMLPPPTVREQLRSEGIRRLVIGHTPNGDSPSILRVPGFEQVIADNSHSRVPEGAKVLLDDERTVIDAVTLLDDGLRHRVHFELQLDDEATPIGRRLRTTSELLKGRLESGDYVGFRYLPEYKCTQRAVPAAEVHPGALTDPD